MTWCFHFPLRNYDFNQFDGSSVFSGHMLWLNVRKDIHICIWGLDHNAIMSIGWCMARMK